MASNEFSNADKSRLRESFHISALGNNAHYEGVSAATRLFCEAARELHKRNFVRVCYTKLRTTNGSVSLDDFKRATEFCQEFVMDVCTYYNHVYLSLD
jgi:hypothetical protein